MMRKPILLLCAVILLLVGFLAGHFSNFILASNGPPSSVPPYIHYQGMLLDPATQNPVPDNTYSVTFTIYDAESGGSAIWSETQSVDVERGLFSVLLGSVTELTTTVFAGKDRFLGVQVGTDPEMTPRQRLASVPYAYQAEHALQSDNATNAINAQHALLSDNATNATTLQGETPGSFLKYNPLQIALLRWYGGNQFNGEGIAYSLGETVGMNPMGIAFDGANMWVANNGTHNVKKVRVSDGTVLATYGVGNDPIGVAYDGRNIWVTNSSDNTVSRLSAADGTGYTTYSVGCYPTGIAFDGIIIWVANNLDGTVTKLNASSGAPVGDPISVGITPWGVAFDGGYIWVANYGTNDVIKLDPSTGVVKGTYYMGENTHPMYLAFDGANIWVTNNGGNFVTKLRASDGQWLGAYQVGIAPYGIAFDGANIWVANYGSRDVTKLRASDGTPLGTYNVINGPYGVAFDGANIWITNVYGYVTKL